MVAYRGILIRGAEPTSRSETRDEGSPGKYNYSSEESKPRRYRLIHALDTIALPVVEMVCVIQHSTKHHD